MTGPDLAKVEQLPDTTGLKNEVIIQKGHVVWFGASVPQMVRLTGAKVVEIGDATRAGTYQLEGAINENTAAALYVVSHHTVQYGLISLEGFCRVAHAHEIPVIVDAASESNMSSFLERGADLVCFSGHKFLAPRHWSGDEGGKGRDSGGNGCLGTMGTLGSQGRAG